MDIKSVDPTLREWLFAREMMRRLGFTPDELVFVVNPKGQSIIENGQKFVFDKPMLSLLLKAQGKTFSWTIGMTDIPENKLEEVYEKICAEWNSGEEFPMEEFYRSESFSRRIDLVRMLQSKGFVLSNWN